MRVLIADRDVMATQSLASLLSAWGYATVVVHDGPSALALLRTQDPPRLALLDWNLPGLDGKTICSAIRADRERPYIYMVLITEPASKEQLLSGLEEGADDCLAKPVDHAELHARLSAGTRIVRLQQQLATQRQLKQQASHDSLTGLWNRESILEILDRELARSRRDGRPVGVIMADLDHFKQINDAKGHLTGDRVLRQASQRLMAGLRPYDTVGRYGGEEFLIVLPGCGPDTAYRLAERLRRCVEAELLIDDGTAVTITLSLGVAVWDGSMQSQDLLLAADNALYRAKNAGRNRARLAGDGRGSDTRHGTSNKATVIRFPS